MYKAFMRRCFDIAKLYKGATKINPNVGAIIVSKEKIISEGAHECFGEAHAEVNAIKNVVDESILRKSTIFVSLEPCFHQGKTPPCVNLILQKQIPNVAIACTDPNPLVAGNSIKVLQSSDIQVIKDIEREKGERLIRPFTTNIKRKRPYIVLKFAQSLDKKIGYSDRQIWLSNTFSKHLVHKWRSEVDAVLVGSNTALIDNPALDNRLFYGKRKSVRIMLDRYLKVPFTHHIYDNNSNTIVLTTKKQNNNDNTLFLTSDFEGDYLERFMQQLYEKEIGTVLVEGGAFTLNAFIEAGLWDEARVFQTKKVLGGKSSIAAPFLDERHLVKKEKLLNDELWLYENRDNWH